MVRSNYFEKMPNIHEVNHCDSLYTVFAQFYLDEETSDVVIAVEDKKFPVHRLMLASHADFFKTLLFGKNFKEAEQNEIQLPGISAEAFGFLLEYFYKGAISLESHDIAIVIEVWELSRRYALKKLEESIASYLKTFVNKTNVGLVSEMAALLDSKEVEESCVWIVAMSVEDIYELDVALNLNPVVFIKLLSRLSEKVSAIKLFRVASKIMKKWAHDSEVVEKIKKAIKEDIQFTKIPSEQILADVWESNVFSPDEYHTLLKTLHGKGLLSKVTKDVEEVEDSEFEELEKGLYDLGEIMLFNSLKCEIGFFSYSYRLDTSSDFESWDDLMRGYVAIGDKDIHFPERSARYIRFSTFFPADLSKIKLIKVSYIENPPHQVNSVQYADTKTSFQAVKVHSRSGTIHLSKLAKFEEKGPATGYIFQKLADQTEHGCFSVSSNLPLLLDSCRFRLWDYDGRKYSYTVRLKTDSFSYRTVSDRRNELVDGWQTLQFSPLPVTEILVFCTKVSGDKSDGEFRIAYFEAPAQFSASSSEEKEDISEEPFSASTPLQVNSSGSSITGNAHGFSVSF